MRKVLETRNVSNTGDEPFTISMDAGLAPPEIIEILNINANCNLLEKWDSNTDSKTKSQILRGCNNLVNKWLFGRSPDFLKQNSTVPAGQTYIPL